mgnify:CR=1 FL=1
MARRYSGRYGSVVFQWLFGFIFLAFLLFHPSESQPAVSKPGSKIFVPKQEALPWDLGVGSVTIDTQAVIPGMQTENLLEGTFFIYGNDVPVNPLPVVIDFEIYNSNNELVFSWQEQRTLPNGNPPTFHYEGHYQYQLPDNQSLPLDYYLLRVRMEIDGSDPNLFPNGQVPVEADPFNNTNESTFTRILQLSGKVIFGNITTQLTAIDSFDANALFFSGSAIWNTDIPFSFVGITATRDDVTLDLTVTAGSAAFVTPQTPYQPGPDGFSYFYLNGTLTPAGAFADLSLPLPPGIAYRKSGLELTYSEAPLPLGNQKLDQNLQIENLPLNLALPLQWISEDLPFFIESTGVTFDPATGLQLNQPQCVYQYAPHLAAFPIVEGPFIVGIIRPSNDAYFNSGLVFQGGVVIQPGGLDCDLQAANVSYLASFPLAQVTGVKLKIQIRENRIVATESGFESLQLSMPLDTSGCAAEEPGPVAVAFQGPSGIGPDGAVVNDSPLTAPLAPAFNTYQFAPTANAAWYQPGFHLPSAAAAGQGKNVAEYLQAMRARENAGLYSYGDGPFRDGSGLFAGINLFPSEFNGQSFTVAIDSQTKTMVSTEWTKLYLRPGGYSGVVDAQSQNDSLELYKDPDCQMKGYAVQLTSFGQAYLDNNSKGLDTTTEGIIDIPWPALITVPFEKMTLNACGNLDQGKITAGAKNEEKLLAYWVARFRLLTLAFEKTTPASPDAERTLWVSTKNPIEHVTDEAAMQINLRPCGTIANSRIEQPLLTHYDGYPASIQKIYLSAFDNNPTVPNGFYNLIGDMTVSLFDPPKIHAIVNGFVGNLADGSPWFGAGNPDTDADGFPDGQAPTGPTAVERVAAYVEANPIEVRTKFANLITLKYKLKYIPTDKEFRTQTPIQEDLIVLDMVSAVEYLNTVRTEITFGVDVIAQPKLNLSSKFSKFSQDIANSFLGPVRDKLDAVANGLRVDLSVAVRPALAALMEPIVAEFMQQLQSQLAGLPQSSVEYQNYLLQANAAFDQLLDQMMNQLDLAALLTKRDMPAMQAIRIMLDLLNDIETALNFSPEQLSPLVRAIVNHTMRGAQSFGVDINQLLAPVEKIRQEIRTVIQTKVRPALEKAEQVLDPALLLDQVFPLNEVKNQLVPQIKQAVKAKLLAAAQTDFPSLNVLAAREITQRILDQVFNSPQFQKLTISVNTQLMPVQDLLRDQAQKLLDSLNRTVEDFVKQQIGQLEGALEDFKNVKGFKGASMKGYAVVAGNVLEKLHIDGSFSISTTDDITFNAYLDMTRYQVGYKGKNCSAPIGSGPVMDTRLGAKDVPLDLAGSSLKADIEFQFMINNGKLINVGGSFIVRGGLNVGKLPIKDPGFRVSIGSDENYLVAFVSNIGFSKGNLKGGIFLGETYCLDPLIDVNKDAPNMFKPGRFRGIFASAEGSFPIVNYGCLLTVGAEGGLAFWVFADGPVLGGKIYAGIFGEAACVVSAKGRLTLLGGYDGSDFVFRGDAWIAGGIGFCEEEDWNTPADVLDDGWCMACVASFDLMYKNDWRTNYDVECD